MKEDLSEMRPVLIFMHMFNCFLSVKSEIFIDKNSKNHKMKNKRQVYR